MDLLYKNIRQRRIALGMSQEELATKLGYTSRSSINKIEKGKSDIPQSKIEAFAKALNISPAELMGWENNVTTEFSSDSALYDSETVQLLKNFEMLNLAGKERLIEFSEMLLSKGEYLACGQFEELEENA